MTKVIVTLSIMIDEPIPDGDREVICQQAKEHISKGLDKDYIVESVRIEEEAK